MINASIAKVQIPEITPVEQFLLEAENLVLRAKAHGISVVVAVDTDKEKPYITTNTTPQTSDAIFLTIVSLAANYPGILTIPEISHTTEGAA